MEDDDKKKTRTPWKISGWAANSTLADPPKFSINLLGFFHHHFRHTVMRGGHADGKEVPLK